jgi:hypothetical protein
MELVSIFVFYGLGMLVGFGIHKRMTVDYKTRWQEALIIIKHEKLSSEELKEIEPPQEIPERLKGLPFTPSFGKDSFKNLSAAQREEMEMLRLHQGLPPRDSMGGATSDAWTRVRKAQLRAGWEYFDERYYKVQ